MRSREKLLSLILVLLVSVVATAQIAPPSTGDATNDTSGLDGEEYARVLSRVFPKRLDPRPFPEGARLLVVGFVRDAYRLSEFWFSMQVGYDGTVLLVTKAPKYGSVEQQLRALRRERPSATLPELVADLRIDERRFTERQIPELRDVARDFRRIRMSPEMPDVLFSDPYTYDLWSTALWGQEMSAKFYWPGPDAKRQQPVIVEWMERVRSAVAPHIIK